MHKAITLIRATVLFLLIQPAASIAEEPSYTRLSVSPSGQYALLWDELLTSTGKKSARNGHFALIDLSDGTLQEREFVWPIEFIEWYHSGNQFFVKFEQFFSTIPVELDAVENIATTARQRLISWQPLSYLSEQTVSEFEDLTRSYLPRGSSPLASSNGSWHSLVGESISFDLPGKPISSYRPVSKWHYERSNFWYHVGVLGSYPEYHQCAELVQYHFRPIIDRLTGSLAGCFSHTELLALADNTLPEPSSPVSTATLPGHIILDAMSNGEEVYYLLHRVDGAQFIAKSTNDRLPPVPVYQVSEIDTSFAPSDRSMRYISDDSNAPFGFLNSVPGAKTLVIRFHGGPGGHPLASITDRLTSQIMRSDADILEVFAPGSIGSGEAIAKALEHQPETSAQKLLEQVAEWVFSNEYDKIVLVGTSFGGPYAAHLATKLSSLEPHLILLAPSLEFQANRLITGQPYDTDGPQISFLAQQHYERAMFGPNFSNRRSYEKLYDEALKILCSLPNSLIFYGSEDRRVAPLSEGACGGAGPRIVMLEGQTHSSLGQSKDAIEQIIEVIDAG